MQCKDGSWDEILPYSSSYKNYPIYRTMGEFNYTNVECVRHQGLTKSNSRLGRFKSFIITRNDDICLKSYYEKRILACKNALENMCEKIVLK